MLLDPAPIEKLFQSMEKSLSAARTNLGRKLTIVEKNIGSGCTSSSKNILIRFTCQ